MFLQEVYQKKLEEIKKINPKGERNKKIIPFDINLPEKRVIAEVKQASPSLGVIKKVDVVKQAKRYEAGGAAAISVLTDKNYFNGSFEFLRMISQEVELPLLCKDFIIDKRQIDMAYINGADTILLIVALINDDLLHLLFEYAVSLGLNVLVEIHDKNEFDRVKDLGIKFLGVNSRNLNTLKIDKDVALDVLKSVEGDFVKVAESGIETIHDVEKFKEAGAAMFLVGTSLMKSENPEDLIMKFNRV
ncbi:indole-3-glycerol phosphate synthase TrpC [Deferribacter thermophilus]|uniref:indole-3-glycerol phosphate synthase TrpC n=1 Tax=Deferribacter thermophilus TaxID=53573 RepID=UPI003C221B7E